MPSRRSSSVTGVADHSVDRAGGGSSEKNETKPPACCSVPVEEEAVRYSPSNAKAFGGRRGGGKDIIRMLNAYQTVYLGKSLDVYLSELEELVVSLRITNSY